jgi:hypothetical protein
MLIILAMQEAEIRRIMVQSQLKANSSQDPHKTPFTKWLVEWLKVYALSSSPNTTKRNSKNRRVEQVLSKHVGTSLSRRV